MVDPPCSNQHSGQHTLIIPEAIPPPAQPAPMPDTEAAFTHTNTQTNNWESVRSRVTMVSNSALFVKQKHHQPQRTEHDTGLQVAPAKAEPGMQPTNWLSLSLSEVACPERPLLLEGLPSPGQPGSAHQQAGPGPQSKVTAKKNGKCCHQTHATCGLIAICSFMPVSGPCFSRLVCEDHCWPGTYNGLLESPQTHTPTVAVLQSAHGQMAYWTAQLDNALYRASLVRLDVEVISAAASWVWPYSSTTPIHDGSSDQLSTPSVPTGYYGMAAAANGTLCPLSTLAKASSNR